MRAYARWLTDYAWYMVALLFVTVALDYTATWCGVMAHGISVEANPWLRGAMREIGVVGALGFAVVQHLWVLLLVVLGARMVGSVLCFAGAVGHLFAFLTWFL